MNIQYYLAQMAALGATILMPHGLSAQEYPVKPIRIVTSEPGGAGDIVARTLAQGMLTALGQPVIVDNRSGALPGETVARSTPDGTVLLLEGGTFFLAPLMQKIAYDVLKDFATITQAIRSPNVLVVHSSVAAGSVKELIALARAKPGQLNYASGANGVPTHLAAELFKFSTGANIVRIPYKGTGPALTGLIAGETQLMFPTSSAASPHIKSGKLRALAVTSPEPSALVPGLPPLAETVPGFEWETIIGLYAPAKTPAAIIRRLNQESVRTLLQPEVKDRFFSVGIESVGSSPEQFAAVIGHQIGKWGKVIRDTGIRAE